MLMLCHATSAAELFGKVDAISGSAFLADKNVKSSEIFLTQKIYEGQTINTTSDGEVHITTEDGGVIALRPDTVFRVDEYRAEGGPADKIFMSLLKGTIRSITGWIGKHDNSAYLISTPTATIGIRGTDHETTVIDQGDGDEPGTYDTVNEGATLLKTQHGNTEVTPGKFAFAPKGRALAPFFLARQPNYWSRRKLKIEGRIQQRKEYFRNHMEEMRNEHIKRQENIRRAHNQVDKRNEANQRSNDMARKRRNFEEQQRLKREKEQQVRMKERKELKNNNRSKEENPKHKKRNPETHQAE
jgi:hypothetical protein